MSQLDDTYNNAQGWTYSMPPPRSFDHKAQAAFQKRIDAITGTRNTRPIVKLAWAPEELRWHPYKMGGDVPGYTFPIFFYGYDLEGRKVAAPRWVLLQRAEPQHYAATWEAGRYIVRGKDVWDARGPCPSERYTELKAHCYHDGECCPCYGLDCACGIEELEHCWGKYIDPNERLLDWVREVCQAAQSDPDVSPNTDTQDHSAPNAQRQWVSDQQQAEEKRVIGIADLDREMNDFWQRKPVSLNLKRSESGLYLLN